MGPNLQPYDFFVTRQKGFYSDFFTSLKSTSVLKHNGIWHIWEQNDAFEGWFKLSSTALKIITPYDLSNKMEAPVSHAMIFIFHPVFKCVERKRETLQIDAVLSERWLDFNV